MSSMRRFLIGCLGSPLAGADIDDASAELYHINGLMLNGLATQTERQNTIIRAIVDLMNPSYGKSMGTAAYVMLSRVKSLDGLTILRPFNGNVLQQGQSQDLQAELTRIEKLDKETTEGHM